MLKWLRKIFGSASENRIAGETAEPEQPLAKPGASANFALNTAWPLFIDIKEKNGTYSGRIHQGDRKKGVHIPEMSLGKSVKPVSDSDLLMADIVKAIIEYEFSVLKPIDERALLDVGQYLYAQTLGRLPENVQDRFRNENAIAVRILANDEWIAGLPWPLLADNGIHFSIKGRPIMLCGGTRTAPRELPPCPRLLIIAPKYAGTKDTQSRDHIRDLEDALSGRDPDQPLVKIEKAETWTEFEELADTFQPELVYYYGHGTGNKRRTRLDFPSDPRPVGDFASCLRRLDNPPLIAYINCCQGDAGGFLGAGFQLRDFVPVVITNRTCAEIRVAREQAVKVWTDILLHAVPPDKAVSALYARMNLKHATTADFRWITPVLHADYSQWKAKPAQPSDRLTGDPHWDLKIDRINQYNSVIAQTRLMMREQKPKSLVFVWYGKEGQGVDLFHERLLVELQEELTSALVHPVEPIWPAHLTNYHSSFGGVLTKEIGVNSVDDIPARLRRKSKGKPILLYVRHQPVIATNLINPESLKKYVQWWDSEFASNLEKNQYALLTVSFIVGNPPAFFDCMAHEAIDLLPLKHTVFWLLDEMENIAKRDLLLFLRTHNINLPEEDRDGILQEILEETGGKYDLTVDELKKLKDRVWRARKKNRPKKKKFDYM